MNITLFVLLLFILQIFYWYVGQRSAKKLQGQEDYFLAGKSVKLFPLMMTFLATQVGGGVILGAAEEAYKYGWPVLLYPLGASLGFICLGSGIGSRLAKLNISTVAQIFEIVYDSVVLKKIASLLSIVSLFMVLVAQIIASQKFLVSLGFSSIPLFIIFWAIVIFYTARGGLRAVISTDIVQALLFSFVFLLCFGFVFFYEPAVSLIQMPHLNDFADVSSKLSGWLLMPLLFMVIEQDMGQRCFAGASPKTVSKASLLAGICTMIICIVPVFLGSLAKGMEIDIVEGGSVLMAVITKVTNPWITALVGCAVLAAIISTASSLINAIGSNISNDFKLNFIRNRESMLLPKAITSIISIAAIFFAFYFDNIVDLLIQSYELYVSALFIPIAMALSRKKGNFIAALLSLLCGTLGFILFRMYPIEFPREIATIILSLLGYCCGESVSYFSERLKISKAEIYEK